MHQVPPLFPLLTHRINAVAVLDDNLYIADQGNQRIRKVVLSTAIINTFAGTGATGYNSDNIAATSATLYNPCGVSIDSAGTAEAINLNDPDNYSHLN